MPSQLLIMLACPPWPYWLLLIIMPPLQSVLPLIPCMGHGPYSSVPFFGAACFYRAPGTTMNGCSTTWERDSWGEQHYGSATSAANCAAQKAAYDEWCGTTRSQLLRPDTSKCNPVQALVLLAHIMAWCLPNSHIILKCMISVAPIRRYVTIPTASLLLLCCRCSSVASGERSLRTTLVRVLSLFVSLF